MSESKLTFELTEPERITLLCGLGTFTPVVMSGGYTLLTRDQFFLLVNRLAGNMGAMNAVGALRAGEKMAAVESAAKDYFARDSRGNPTNEPPKDAKLTAVTVMQTETRPSRDKTTIYVRVLHSGGTANCFDKDLSERIRQFANGKTVGLWLQASGKYTNIVGVRA